MTCKSNTDGLFCLFKLKTKTMKKLILVLFTVLILAGCGNPIGTDSKSNKDLVPADTLHFGIYQNYGMCDTQCVGQSIVLLTGIAISDRGYGYEYTVGNDSLWDGLRWLLSEGVFIDYYTTGTYTFTVETGDDLFYSKNSEVRQLSVGCSQNYVITFQ